MLKKYILIGILVITVALALSAFTLVSVNRSTGSLVGQTQASAILDKGERDSIPFFPETGFRTPPRRSSASPSIAVTGFRTPPMSNYVSSSAVSGVQTPHHYQYGPASAVTGIQMPPITNYLDH